MLNDGLKIMVSNYKIFFRWSLVVINVVFIYWFGFAMPGTGFIEGDGRLNFDYIILRTLLVVGITYIAGIAIIAPNKWSMTSILISTLVGAFLLWAGLMANSMSEYSGFNGFLYGVTTFLTGFTLALLLCALAYIFRLMYIKLAR